jgi:hypothetical protein
MGDVLLGGGWNALGPNSFVMRLNDRAPQGLGVLSGSALELSPDFPPSTPATAQAAPAWVAPLRAATLIQSAAPDAVSGPDEPLLPGPLRGIAAAPQGNRWTRPEIPTGAIAQATRLLTPGVGSVRATLHGGEVFEGRLHQVGMGQIWINTRLGRMSLESHRLARLETLESPGPARTGDRMGSRRLDQLTQVSVRVPGGLLTGALLDRKGNRVTLRIADGLQITVTSEDVRPLSDSSATLGVRPRGAGQRE